jgi:hypothetical protein
LTDARIVKPPEAFAPEVCLGGPVPPLECGCVFVFFPEQRCYRMKHRWRQCKIHGDDSAFWDALGEGAAGEARPSQVSPARSAEALA